jgi:hypothetical protein
MRWKMLIIASAAAAIIGFGIWSAVVIGIYGSAASLARNDALLLASAVPPLVLSGLAGFFAYRHTARRRKLQGLITMLLALLLTIIAYAVVAVLAPNRFYIPRAYEERPRP